MWDSFMEILQDAIGIALTLCITCFMIGMTLTIFMIIWRLLGLL